MAEKKSKRPSLGATVPPPNEKADFFAQLQNTFERGVVTAEVDLSGLINQQGGGGSVVTMFGEADRITTGPAGVHDQVIKKMKDIANTFGGSFNVHAPLQANPADFMSVGRAKSAELLKKSMEYTEKLGGKNITVHPIGQMEYYFVDPFVGTKIPLPNPFYLARNENELNGLMKNLKVKDPLLKDQIKKEWRNFVHTIPMTFAEKYGALTAQDMESFSDSVSQVQAANLIKKYRGNPKKIEGEMKKLSENMDPKVRRNFEALRLSLFRGEGMNDALADRIMEGASSQERIVEDLWPKISMGSLKPINIDGTTVQPSQEYVKLLKKYRNKTITKSEKKKLKKLGQKYMEQEEDIRIKAWERVLAPGRRFGPFEESQEDMLDNVVDTFRRIFRDAKSNKGKLYKALKNGKMTIGLENLFPAMPEKGYMQGYAYFYKPEHMAKLIKEVRKAAKENGIPEDAVGMTFDLAHAASAGIKPSKFLKELKKKGIKPNHVHVVGGPGYGHGHIAWGDWLDEVSRMDPGIISKLADVGAINIEGGAGLHDVEVTVNALWDKGIPLEALMAMSGGPTFTPGLGSYWAPGAPAAYMSQASSYSGSHMPVRSFYSFQNEMTPAPMQSAFGSYTAPALFGGGYSVGPGRTSAFWQSSQPLLYSSKNER